MKKRNEKTSARVATKAAAVMNTVESALMDIADMRVKLHYIENYLIAAKSVAASALTQAADKKKR